MPSRRSRRSLLGGLAALTLGALGGCLTRIGRDLPVAETTESVRGVPRSFDGMPDASPFTVLAVGDRRFVVPPRAPSHSLWVWNDSGSPRVVPLRLSLDDGNFVFGRDVSFPADGVFAVELLEPADYRLEIGGDGETETVTVGSELFDCNDSATDVAIWADGSVDSRVIATTMGCGPLS